MVDPIDGTKNFVRGVPVWATLISLMVDDEVVVGVVSAPLLNRRWWAMKDGGAWTGKSLMRAAACQVSDVSRIEDASLSYSSLHGLGRARPARRLPLALAAVLAHPCVRRLLELHAASPRVPSTSPPSPSSSCYDMAAIDVIVREAGGVFTSLDGEPGPLGGSALATNGKLHDQALAFLGSLSEHDDEPPRAAPCTT